MELHECIESFFDIGGERQIQQSREELKKVLKELEGKRFNNYVEIGGSFGGSLWVYANMVCNKGANITVLELAPVDALRKTIKKLTDNEFKVRLIPGHSWDAPIVENIDLLHIDSQHDYDVLKGEFDKYFPYVIKGGVVLIHDTLLHEGCIQFREELEKTHSCKTFDSAGDELTCGITMVVKK